MAYNPQDHTASNKPYGVIRKAIDARTYFYDKGLTFVYRQYMSIQQVIEYLDTTESREGHFVVIINTGGTILPSGYISGGINDEYWFRDGVLDDDLVIRSVNVDVAAIEQELQDINTILDKMIANRIPIPITALEDTPTIINWQTDLVPNDPYGRTYVNRFGNIIQDIINYYEDLGTTYKNSAEFSYTKTGSIINVVTFPANSLQTGTISIL